MLGDGHFKASPIYLWGAGLQPLGWDCFLALSAVKLENGRPRLPSMSSWLQCPLGFLQAQLQVAPPAQSLAPPT